MEYKFSRQHDNYRSNEVLARPVFASNTATQDRVLIVASNRSVTGGFTSSVSSQAYGGDILLRRRLGQNNNVRWDLLMGYQGNRISDNLSIYSQSNDGKSNDELRDSFVTRNQFDGMAIGLGHLSRWCNWSLDAPIQTRDGELAKGNDDLRIGDDQQRFRPPCWTSGSSDKQRYIYR